MMNTQKLRDTLTEAFRMGPFAPPTTATAPQVHKAVATAVLAESMTQWQATEEKRRHARRVSYLSAEFLMGRLVYNNLLALGLLKPVEEALKWLGASLHDLEEVEDAALGNGGLGRLAACFLDSAATVGVPLDGYGLYYKYGLFKQDIIEGHQVESPDDWTKEGDPWSIRRPEEKISISFADGEVWAVPYDMPIFGYESQEIGTLRLWQAEPITPFDFGLFNDQAYDASVQSANRAEDISRVLYPNDDQPEGKRLRLKQQYFFCSASIQDLLRKFEAVHGTDYGKIPQYHAVQLNDTHPSIAIPELLRILIHEKGLSYPEASRIGQEVFNYTNHTTLPEALERWDVAMIQENLPPIWGIIQQMQDELVKTLEEKHSPQERIDSLSIIQGSQVHMAELAVFFCGKTNGVAAIHSQILRDDLFKDWYAIYPERFTNMTNGVTQRRWLALCNPELSDLYTRLLGSSAWVKDLSLLKDLAHFKHDEGVLREFLEIKRKKRVHLGEFLEQDKGITIDPNTIFDTQIKRIHEYKRQYLNILTILALYYEIKDGTLGDFAPTTFLFGGKSAPGYHRAKGIIKLINEVAAFIKKDADVSQLLQVVFVPNYNVTAAQHLIAATDISQQISTAGTEASGTGNMKFMMNGAVTLGTYDGANVEIVAEAGRENNFIFGATIEELAAIKESYDPRHIYDTDPVIKRVLDTLINGTLNDGGSGIFRELHNTLLEPTGWSRADQYYLLHDFHSYLDARKNSNLAYQNPLGFAALCWANLSHSGHFSSDRTIRNYAEGIWRV